MKFSEIFCPLTDSLLETSAKQHGFWLFLHLGKQTLHGQFVP